MPDLMPDFDPSDFRFFYFSAKQHNICPILCDFKKAKLTDAPCSPGYRLRTVNFGISKILVLNRVRTDDGAFGTAGPKALSSIPDLIESMPRHAN